MAYDIQALQGLQMLAIGITRQPGGLLCDWVLFCPEYWPSQIGSIQEVGYPGTQELMSLRVPKKDVGGEGLQLSHMEVFFEYANGHQAQGDPGPN